MAKILILENRDKTFFWSAVARLLERDGHTISWLVQNPLFARNLPGTVEIMAFPKGDELEPGADLDAFPAVLTDRGRVLFEAGSAHYAYYQRCIAARLDADRPDVLLCEPTLFHELLAIELCRARGIACPHPVGERYPPNRFVVFDGDTQTPLIESGDRIDPGDALEMARNIHDGRAIPTYMVTGGRLARARDRWRWARTRGRVIVGRWRGERYNTPSLRRKLALNRMSRRNLERWAAAATLPSEPSRTILYPLQQQPENTIDVWGRPDNDQVEIVRRILAATDRDVRVAIKANPKPFYELSDELLDLALADPRIDLIPVEMRMAQALDLATGAVTVTGTVGYEAVFGRGRCISTNHPVLERHFPEFAAGSIEEAATRLLSDPSAGRGSVERGAQLLERLVARSFPGWISDPVSAPASMASANIAAVAHAVSLTIQALEQRPRGAGS